MVKRVYPACDALSKRLFRFRQVIRKGQRPAVLRGVGVMQLSQQVQHLSERTERLSQLYSENRR
ncbi:MbeD/MobD family mobilization/exclusion protein [Escherichia coli]|uniref:MbeD/MobD family mobilization/exclusion protein n=1 Tax=Escherichia coli TaxID=562 RepID=UPI003EDF4105